MPREDSPGEGRVVLSDADIARALKRKVDFSLDPGQRADIQFHGHDGVLFVLSFKP